MAPIQDQIDLLVRCIVDAVHPLKIVLFGSASRDEMRSGSDIDVLVVMPDGVHRGHIAQHLYQAVNGVATPFDILVSTPSDLEKHKDNPWLIYKTILEEGRILYAA